MTRTPVLSLLCAATLAVVVSGCGSSASNSGLSNSQLAATVNAACDHYTKAALAVPQASDLTRNLAHAASYLDKLLALAKSTFGPLKGLDVQGAIKADYSSFIADEGHQVALVGEADAKAHARDPSALRLLQLAVAYKQAKLVPLDRRLGFTSCLK